MNVYLFTLTCSILSVMWVVLDNPNSRNLEPEREQCTRYFIGMFLTLTIHKAPLEFPKWRAQLYAFTLLHFCVLSLSHLFGCISMVTLLCPKALVFLTGKIPVPIWLLAMMLFLFSVTLYSVLTLKWPPILVPWICNFFFFKSQDSWFLSAVVFYAPPAGDLTVCMCCVSDVHRRPGAGRWLLSQRVHRYWLHIRSWRTSVSWFMQFRQTWNKTMHLHQKKCYYF